MSAFNRAWIILKIEDDEQPNPDVFRPPRDAFEAMRNNPTVMDFIGENGENLSAINPNMHECKHCGGRTNIDREDVWSDDFCSKRCEQGEDPTCQELYGRNCDFVLKSVDYSKSYSRDSGIASYEAHLECPQCYNYLWGYVS